MATKNLPLKTSRPSALLQLPTDKHTVPPATLSMLVSNATPAEFVEVANLVNNMLQTTENRAAENAKLLSGLQRAQQDNNAPFYVAKNDLNEVLGFILAAGSELTESRDGYLQKITTQVTHPGCRGQGVGRLLYDAAVAESRAKGCIGIIADCFCTNYVGMRHWTRMGHEWNGLLPMVRYFN